MAVPNMYHEAMSVPQYMLPDSLQCHQATEYREIPWNPHRKAFPGSSMAVPMFVLHGDDSPMACR